MVNIMAPKLQPCLRIRNTWAGLSRSDRRSLVSHAPFNRPSLAAALSYHWDTLPPTPEQLNHASKFFTARPPAFLYSAEKFLTMDYGESPEVCLLGRSNVGKSSLLNAILDKKKIANVSATPGRTRLMNAFAVGGEDDDRRNRLVVLDMPGYGKGGRAEWGKEIMKYLEKRKQLKGTFLLIDIEHGAKESDEQLLALIQQIGIPYQVILSKADKIVGQKRGPRTEAVDVGLAELRRIMEGVKDWVQPNSEDDGGAVGEVIACSTIARVNGKRMGIDAIRFAMLRAAGLEYRPSIPLGRQVDIIPHEEIFGIQHG